MKPMTPSEAAAVLRKHREYLEAYFPTHPANQCGAREMIYALNLAVDALEHEACEQRARLEQLHHTEAEVAQVLVAVGESCGSWNP